MAHDWTKDKAEWLVDTIREQGHYYFKLEPKQARAEAEAALRDARTEERNGILARLREPDEAMVDALSKGLSDGDSEVTWRERLRTGVRALAEFLDHP